MVPAPRIGSDDIGISTFRQWFKQAVDKNRTWRDEAEEDYKFYRGDQWDDQDLQTLKAQNRPVITINRIMPLINMLSGYQRLNRYEPDFLPRTPDDIGLCKVRKAMTKFIFDISDYDTVESRVFFDTVICGRGWFEVCYDWDNEIVDGEAKIKRESPFNMYIDPECREMDLSDAKYVFRARWLPKDLLKQIYEDEADVIEAWASQYDTDEEVEYAAMEPLYYQRETKNVRLIECFYKEWVKKQAVLLQDGRIIDGKDIGLTDVLQIVKPIEQNVQTMKIAVFVGDVELERLQSPYEHSNFPFVQLAGYYSGERGDVPAGIVRNLRDAQREINKRRSQRMHVLNTTANSGWVFEEETLSAAQKERWKKFGHVPGAMLEYRAGRQPPQRIDPPPFPAGLAQEEISNIEDLRAISGINEAMLGNDLPAATSGRAIELRQKQSVTSIALLFDNLRTAKKQMLSLLWGTKKRRGIIQQYYTEKKTFRVMGDDGSMEFVTVNQPQDLGDGIERTLNDLSVGDFDIVVSDTPAAATQRVAAFYAALEAIKLGVPIPPDMLVELSDWPFKDEIKRRILEEQQKAQEQQKAMMEQQAMAAQQPQQPKISENISFKDLPPDGKVQMAQRAGIQLDPRGVMAQELAKQQSAAGGLPNPQVQRPYKVRTPAPQQGAPSPMPMQQIWQAVKDGRVTPQMVNTALQQGLINPEVAQGIVAQLRAPRNSAEMQRNLITPAQQQEMLRPSL